VASEYRDAVGIPASFSILGDLYTLPDGRVLSIGGAGPVVEAYEPWTQQTVPLTLVQPMHLLSARAQLADGTILLAGGAVATTGQDKEGNPTLALSTTNEAYVFDPASGVLTPTAGTLTTARAAATATRLSNGKVLVCGGFGSLDVANPLSILTGILASTELYDPATGLFTTGPAMLEGKALHTATTLDNGQVMIAGGLGSFLGIPTVSNTAYFYNPATNAFGLLPKTFTGGRFLHNATRLADGRVILTGGITADLTGVIESGDLTQVVFGTIPSTAIFNPSAGFGGSFSAGQSMLSARALHTSTLLPGGALLVTGGLSGDLDIGAILSGNLEGAVLPVILDNCELLTFNPNASAPAAYLSAPRAGASAIVSPMDGRVIVLGGGPLLVELYQP
jgi:hypothetical protein